jgi:DNA ligase-1
VSRNLKPFRNAWVQGIIGIPSLEGLDGELIVGEPNVGHVLNRTQSGIMSTEGTPDFKFHIFDNVEINHLSFMQRHETLRGFYHSHVVIVPHITVYSSRELLEYEQRALLNGYEGVMIRGINAPYKYGRATNSEHSLFKFKRFRDGEAIVTGIEEGTVNENAAERDALGQSKRSSHQANLKPAGRVGTILGVDIVSGEDLNISPGRMTHDMRHYYFEHPEKLIGSIIKYKSFDYGSLDAPRFTTYQAHRNLEDMS